MRPLTVSFAAMATLQSFQTATNTVVRVGLEHDGGRCGSIPRTDEPLVGLTPGVVFPDGTP